jgi:hypothetical protein
MAASNNNTYKIRSQSFGLGLAVSWPVVSWPVVSWVDTMDLIL